VAPPLTQTTDFVERGEDPRIEHFRAKAFVKAFEVRILGWFAEFDQMDMNAVLQRLLRHRGRQELPAIVNTE
jgi:hypothetical protein